jgi:Rrf2 family protein
LDKIVFYYKDLTIFALKKRMFSKACEYGIKAVIYIAKRSLADSKVSLKEVAKAIDSPEAYTSKILQKLAKNGIINSDKGPTGGFSMDNKELDNVKLSTIVYIIDGDTIYKGCGLGLKECNEQMPCPVHNQFKIIRDDLKVMLESNTVISLTMGVKDGLTFLKR